MEDCKQVVVKWQKREIIQRARFLTKLSLKSLLHNQSQTKMCSNALSQFSPKKTQSNTECKLPIFELPQQTILSRSLHKHTHLAFM